MSPFEALEIKCETCKESLTLIKDDEQIFKKIDQNDKTSFELIKNIFFSELERHHIEKKKYWLIYDWI